MKNQSDWPTIAISVSLSQAKPEQREWIKRMLDYLRSSVCANLLMWGDFDLEKWKTKDDEDVFTHTRSRVLEAKLMVLFFISSDGSDGRGGEATMRFEHGGPMLAFAERGVLISRYTRDLLKKADVEIITYASYIEITDRIRSALHELESPDRTFSI